MKSLNSLGLTFDRIWKSIWHGQTKVYFVYFFFIYTVDRLINQKYQFKSVLLYLYIHREIAKMI